MVARRDGVRDAAVMEAADQTSYALSRRHTRTRLHTEPQSQMDIIDQLMQGALRAQRYPIKRTTIFSDLRHNAALCPTIQAKCDDLLGTIGKYQRIAYDVQGPQDQGADIIIRQTNPDDADNFYCIQVKSNDDLKTKDWLKTVKAAYHDTRSTYKHLIRYWILLCVDGTKHQDAIRAVNAAMTRDSTVQVIAPEHCLGFISLAPEYINAITKRILSDEDSVLLEARGAVQGYTPLEKGMMICAVFMHLFYDKRSFSPEDFFRSTFIEQLCSMTPNVHRRWFFEGGWPKGLLHENLEDIDSEEDIEEYVIQAYSDDDIVGRVAQAIDYLSDGPFSQHAHKDHELNLTQTRPLMALMLDGNIRYGLSDEELMWYTLRVLGPDKGLSKKPPQINWVRNAKSIKSPRGKPQHRPR